MIAFVLFVVAVFSTAAAVIAVIAFNRARPYFRIESRQSQRAKREASNYRRDVVEGVKNPNPKPPSVWVQVKKNCLRCGEEFRLYEEIPYDMHDHNALFRSFHVGNKGGLALLSPAYCSHKCQTLACYKQDLHAFQHGHRHRPPPYPPRCYFCDKGMRDSSATLAVRPTR